jgi:hypothetical protein
MPIRQRLSNETRRREVKMRGKGRHPLIQNTVSPHFSLWTTICDEGNPAGGMTAGRMKNRCGQYHPQVLKDLIDHFLVMPIGTKQSTGQKLYVADPKGKGIDPIMVRVEVELLEDEDGNFFTRTIMPGRAQSPGKIKRIIGKRGINFVVRGEDDPSIILADNVIKADSLDGISEEDGRTVIIEGEVKEQNACKVDAKNAIIVM